MLIIETHSLVDNLLMKKPILRASLFLSAF